MSIWMEYKYGSLTSDNLIDIAEYMRKQIYFLLLITDPNTQNHYTNINVDDAFENVLTNFGGVCSAFFHPRILVNIIGSLESALIDYHATVYTPETFKSSKCRKLILDAGNEVLRLK